MPIREPAISIAQALSCSNYGLCTVPLMRDRAAAATAHIPIRTDLTQHGKCFAFSATTPGRLLASARSGRVGSICPVSLAVDLNMWLLMHGSDRFDLSRSGSSL